MDIDGEIDKQKMGSFVAGALLEDSDDEDIDYNPTKDSSSSSEEEKEEQYSARRDLFLELRLRLIQPNFLYFCNTSLFFISLLFLIIYSNQM
ncbi:hypothetical protein HZS_7337 [Henneguya salminicola]|nr:hypothetical protein HZS_7337 [Henneguya salminicola]